jgi:mannose-1-phosphate guanylyltransferase
MNIVPVILCGGAGSRLWPLSRELHPKPFVTLPGGDTLIRKTFQRATASPDVSRVVTVTNRELMFLASDEYEQVPGRDVELSFILEPFGRDTAAAIGLACMHVAATEGPDSIVLSMPADHLIRDQEGFWQTVRSAAAMAEQGTVVTFGVRPDRPETGFGYIEAKGNRLLRFVEKPDGAAAETYVSSGLYHWNAGIFAFKAKVMLGLMARYCPDLLQQINNAFETAKHSESPGRQIVEIDKNAFSEVSPISIDYAVFEHLTDAGFVECAFDWSDVGSWTAMADMTPPDDFGNRTVGRVMLKGTSNAYVHGSDRLVTVVGLSDLTIVDTADALLVSANAQSQEIKSIYSQLKLEQSETAVLHRTVHRPWGTFTVLGEGEHFKIKRIEVKPKAKLSLQAHRHRSEHWVVVSGRALVTNGDTEILLSANQSTYIPCGNRHRLSNPGATPCVIIEVQSGEYLGEDDIIRFEDVYGRA